VRRRILGLLLLTALVVPVMGVAATPDPFEAMGLVRLDGGARVPAFSLNDLAGRPVQVAPGQGTATIIVFWATW